MGADATLRAVRRAGAAAPRAAQVSSSPVRVVITDAAPPAITRRTSAGATTRSTAAIP
jgi:hypothetical protein